MPVAILPETSRYPALDRWSRAMRGWAATLRPTGALNLAVGPDNHVATGLTQGRLSGRQADSSTLQRATSRRCALRAPVRRTRTAALPAARPRDLRVVHPMRPKRLHAASAMAIWSANSTREALRAAPALRAAVSGIRPAIGVAILASICGTIYVTSVARSSSRRAIGVVIRGWGYRPASAGIAATGERFLATTSASLH
jgi:hypothetical protein